MSSPDHLPPNPTQGQSVLVVCRRTDGKPMKCFSSWCVDDALRPLSPTPLNAELTSNGQELRILADSTQHAKELTITSIAGTTVSMAITTKRVQGSIWSPELDELDIKILQQGFSAKGVTDVYRPPRGSRALLILTFEGSALPPRVTAGYLSYEVRVVIPKPRRCKKCQKYGHSEAKCRAAHVCGQCAGAHETNTCQAQQPRCAACEGDHAVSDSSVRLWLPRRAGTLRSRPYKSSSSSTALHAALVRDRFGTHRSIFTSPSGSVGVGPVRHAPAFVSKPSAPQA